MYPADAPMPAMATAQDEMTFDVKDITNQIQARMKEQEQTIEFQRNEIRQLKGALWGLYTGKGVF